VLVRAYVRKKLIHCNRVSLHFSYSFAMIVVLVEPSCSVTATQRFRFLALETALPAFQVDWQRPPYVECGKPRIRCQAFCAPNIHLQLHHSAISTIIAQTTTALP